MAQNRMNQETSNVEKLVCGAFATQVVGFFFLFVREYRASSPTDNQKRCARELIKSYEKSLTSFFASESLFFVYLHTLSFKYFTAKEKKKNETSRVYADRVQTKGTR